MKTMRGPNGGSRRLQMRAILVPILALFCLVGAASLATAGSYQGDGAYTGTPSPAVTALFAAFPNGGDGLMAALRDLLINNPDLADDVAYVGSRSNAEQQSAAGAALAQAFTALINRGDNSGAARIVSAAQRSGSPVIQAAVTSAVGRTIGANPNLDQSGTTTRSSCTTQTVSPAGPTTTCQ
jgi:hypothetical protein